MTRRFLSHPVSESGSPALRMVWIVARLLTEPRGCDLRELQEELGVSTSTLYAYIQRLKQFRFPWKDREDGAGRVELHTDGNRKVLRLAWASRHARPTGTDAVLFFKRMAALRFAEGALEGLLHLEPFCRFREITQEYREHVRNLHEMDSTELRHLDRKFAVLPLAPPVPAPRPECVKELTRAIEFQHRVRIECRLPDGPWSGVVDPLSLVLHGSDLFLVFRLPDHSQYRPIAVHRITAVKRTGDTFYYPSEVVYRPERLAERHFGYGDPTREPVRFILVLRPDEDLRDHLAREPWHPREERVPLPDGRIRLSFKTRAPEAVWCWILRLGDQVEVLEPRGREPQPAEDVAWEVAPIDASEEGTTGIDSPETPKVRNRPQRKAGTRRA